MINLSFPTCDSVTTEMEKIQTVNIISLVKYITNHHCVFLYLEFRVILHFYPLCYYCSCFDSFSKNYANKCDIGDLGYTVFHNLTAKCIFSMTICKVVISPLKAAPIYM